MKQVRIEVYGVAGGHDSVIYRYSVIARECLLQDMVHGQARYPALCMMDIDESVLVKEINQRKMYMITPAHPNTRIDVITSRDEEETDIASVQIKLGAVTIFHRNGHVNNCSSLKRLLVLERTQDVLEA